MPAHPRRHRWTAGLSLSAALVAVAGLAGCGARRPPIPTVPKVDLPRFMGDWYVIANIPLSAEKGAHNAVESYALEKDGSIATKFTFRKDGFDGETKEYESTAFVEEDGSNASWRVQFIWPFRHEYLIASLAPDYTQTVIARNKRDHVWIMARRPSIPEADYQRLVQQIAAWGYDTSEIRRVPQKW